MKPCYIYSAVSISAQHTFDSELGLLEPLALQPNKVNAHHPLYKSYIPPAALRRMATGVKMGVTAGKKALENANIIQPDAIVIGTGMGCIEDTETFLNAIIKNDEAYLTPTAFIQSTHNTVGAQIALGLQCKAYNNTYVHGALSFESALLDGLLQVEDDSASTVLVGGLDELGKEFIDYIDLIEDKNEGITVPFSEGASFFVLGAIKQQHAVQLKAIKTFSALTLENVRSVFMAFLKENACPPETIDALILGHNGSKYDHYYTEAASCFPKTTVQLKYKQCIGEYFTASAFGLYLGVTLLKNQDLPSLLTCGDTPKKPLKNSIIYNQYNGRDHSLILLSL
ncbi:beta-ketoacyl synthase chain length factor [Bizionia paragorgiae]|uniref:beta-ketoacyl synthase chain length factor n=1 Tax=Bizionia paragorgiae TaxID=283786 RepID=UPI00299D3034|nr:beta-ketoacyl synthase chain length factor [Bizionia paragorgiae]MDX1271882.1 beta-ketoacyl synthase chain length factor [Bizionia paragorgiae]